MRYRIDASQSQLIMRAFADGLSSMFGHDPMIAVSGFGGDVKFASATPDAASLLLLVQAASFAVVGDVKENVHFDKAIAKSNWFPSPQARSKLRTKYIFHLTSGRGKEIRN